MQERVRRVCRPFREWPREESNLRTQIRSLPLYPLSYGALLVSVPAAGATARGYPVSAAVAVAQLVEPRVVVPVVVGSNPIRHLLTKAPRGQIPQGLSPQ
jgi:hypothetical protein